MISATQNTVPAAVSSGRYPPEGARSVRVTVDFSQGSSQVIDLVMMLQRVGMSCIQGAFINNANGSNSVTIRAASTGQEQTIGAGAQGWINFLSPDFDTLTVTSAGTDTLDFHLLNFPVTPHVWGSSGSVPPGLYVLVAGDTMTGPLILSGDPVAPLGAATKQYTDERVLRTGDTMTGALSITVPGPATNFMTITGDLNTNFIAVRYSSLSATQAPANSLRRGRGSIAAPAIVASGDRIGNYTFQAITTAPSTFATCGLWACDITEPVPGPGLAGARMFWSVAPIGAGSVSEIFRMEHATGFSMFGANVVVDQNRLLKLRVYTVATLPAAAVAGAGATAFVSNALAPAWGVAVAGGGAVQVPVYCDGAVWYAG